MTDELDRLFELLVEALDRETRLAVPFSASELYERLVPYRSNRSRLNVATYQDYEMSVLRLLAGERNYLRLEPSETREQLQAEVTAVNPDTAFFRNFPEAQVLINRLAAERHLRGDQLYAPPVAEVAPAGEPMSEPDLASEAPPEDLPFSSLEVPKPTFELVEPPYRLEAHHCVYCGGSLPTGRDVNFCPHCGQPASGEPKCPACGSAVDVGWGYCVSCGRATGFE